jgi:hypothetical protein
MPSSPPGLARSALLLLPALLLAACTSGGSRREPAALRAEGPRATAAFAPLSDDAGEAPPAALPRDAGTEGVRVTWEALAVERDQLENPRLGRIQRGVLPQTKVVLVSEDHPDARKVQVGRVAVEHEGVAVAPVRDADMEALLGALRQRGFFRLATPTGSIARLFDDPDARGQVTVEQGGRSWTIVSVRGQGLDDSTKEIPALYSQAKQSILMMRNATPTMSVVATGRQPLR